MGCFDGVALVRLGSVHTFCCLCILGAVAFGMVGMLGWHSISGRDRRRGTCTIPDPSAFQCECATWQDTGAGVMCTSYEAFFTNVQFALTSGERPLLAQNGGTTDNTTCALKLGPNTVTTCLQSTIDFTSSSTACNLHDLTRNCFINDDLGDKGKGEYLALWIAGIIWGGLAVLCLVGVLIFEAGWRTRRHRKLLEDDTPQSAEEIPGLCSGVHLAGDPVAAKVQGNWSHGKVDRRTPNGHYAVRIDTRVYEVPKDSVRSAGFTEGMWVTAAEDIPGTAGSPPCPCGLLGMVTAAGPSEVHVAMAGASINATAGQVVPSPAVRRGHVVEVSAFGADGPWEEGVVRSIVGDGIVLVNRPGNDPKAFHWVRRPHNVQIERLPDPDEMAVPAHFVFVDPNSSLAPTVMTKEQVDLYGGVRKVAKELSEHRAAPTGKLALSAGILSGTTLVAKHLERQERALQNKTVSVHAPPSAAAAVGGVGQPGPLSPGMRMQTPADLATSGDPAIRRSTPSTHSLHPLLPPASTPRMPPNEMERSAATTVPF